MINDLLLDFVGRASNQATNLAAIIGDAHHVAIDAAPVATMVLLDLLADARRIADRLTMLKSLLAEERS